MSIEQANKIYSAIKSGNTLQEVANSLECSEIEVRGIIEILNTYGKKIELVLTDDNEVPSLCDHTQFQTKKGISNIMGGYFITIYYDDKGNIQYYSPEEVIYNHNDVWEEAGKDMHRVKRLVK